MAFARNLSQTDRTIRVFIGASLVLGAGLLLRHWLLAVVLAVAGLATVVSALVGH